MADPTIEQLHRLARVAVESARVVTPDDVLVRHRPRVRRPIVITWAIVAVTVVAGVIAVVRVEQASDDTQTVESTGADQAPWVRVGDDGAHLVVGSLADAQEINLQFLDGSRLTLEIEHGLDVSDAAVTSYLRTTVDGTRAGLSVASIAERPDIDWTVGGWALEWSPDIGPRGVRTAQTGFPVLTDLDAIDMRPDAGPEVAVSPARIALRWEDNRRIVVHPGPCRSVPDGRPVVDSAGYRTGPQFGLRCIDGAAVRAEGPLEFVAAVLDSVRVAR